MAITPQTLVRRVILDTLLALKADKASPAFTGVVTAPTLKLTGGAAAGRFLKSSTSDGTAVWTPGPVISDVSANFVATTVYLSQLFLYETDTKRLKLGDGVTQYQNLPVINEGVGYDQRNEFVTSSVNYTVVLPATPPAYLMRVIEIRAGAAITVTIPATVKLTTGLTSTLAVPSGKSAFIGLRYSVATQAWYLMSATVEL